MLFGGSKGTCLEASDFVQREPATKASLCQSRSLTVGGQSSSATGEDPGHGPLPSLEAFWMHRFQAPSLGSACSHYPCRCLATVIGDGEWDTVLDASRYDRTELVCTVGEHVNVMA